LLSPFISETTKNKIIWLNGYPEENKEKFLMQISEENLIEKYVKNYFLIFKGGKIKVTPYMKEFWDTIELNEDLSIKDNTKEKNPKGLENSASIKEELLLKKQKEEEEKNKQNNTSKGWLW
jgi:hypothetical protein